MTYDEDGVIVEGARPFLRTAYNYDMSAVSRDTGLACSDVSRARQEMKEECDINVIVERFGLTGELPNDVRVPLEGEFTELLSYQDAMNRLTEAREAFMMYPAAIRERFANDAGKFVSFVSDPKNVEQCREWGIANVPKAAPEPISVRVIPEVPEKGAEGA